MSHSYDSFKGFLKNTNRASVFISCKVVLGFSAIFSLPCLVQLFIFSIKRFFVPTWDTLGLFWGYLFSFVTREFLFL